MRRVVTGVGAGYPCSYVKPRCYGVLANGHVTQAVVEWSSLHRAADRSLSRLMATAHSAPVIHRWAPDARLNTPDRTQHGGAT